VKIIRSAPKDPGIYIFRQDKISLYVGKAANLRDRLKSYLPVGRQGLKITDSKTQSLHEEATKLSYITLRSDIEALIEESKLIKKLEPKYNILWRDDKSYLYVALTRQSYPKIFITHKSLNAKRYTSRRKVGTPTSPLKNLNEASGLNPTLIGPFTDGNALRLVMKIIRRYFPYCTCFRPHFRDCLNAQIGKCLGFCCKKTTSDASEVEVMNGEKKEYARNIRKIKMILRGQSKKLLKSLTNEKEKGALEKIFEHRDFVQNVGNVRDVRNEQAERSNPEHPTSNISRIECYDISNFAGKEAVGAMTALMKHESGIMNYEWVADKSQWRKFRIKSAPTRDDPRMIYEIVSRRLKHTEWPYPDLIVIDGGITQYHAALKAQSETPEAKNIKITAYPKPQKVLLGWPNAPKEILELAERAIYQTHNFVIRYHRQVRDKALFDIIK